MSVLEELARLRQFSDDATGNREVLTQRITQLEDAAREAVRDHANALQGAAELRYRDLTFLRQLLCSVGRIGALSQDPGQ